MENLTMETKSYNELLALKQEADALNARLKVVDKLLKVRLSSVTKSIDGKEAVCGDLKFLQVQRAGGLDNEAIEKAGIDLSDYRKPPTMFWKLSVMKSIDITNFEEAAE